MRDPKRIDEFVEVLKECWKKVPDWRFGQLVTNAIGSDPFLFYCEDDDVLERLKKMFGQNKND